MACSNEVFVFFEEIFWRAVAVENVGVPSPKHVIDQTYQLGQVELNAVLECLPVVELNSCQHTLLRVKCLLLLSLLVAALLFLVTFAVIDVASHPVGECTHFLLLLKAALVKG